MRVDFVVDVTIDPLACAFFEVMIRLVTDVSVESLTDVSVNVALGVMTALEFTMSASLEE